MIGERSALHLAEETYAAEGKGSISQSDAAESSANGGTEMVNPPASGDELDGEQEETSGRREDQGANANEEFGSGGETELVAVNGDCHARDENSVQERLGVESTVEPGEEIRAEFDIRLVATGDEEHVESVAAGSTARCFEAQLQTAEATESKILVNKACSRVHNTTCQENRGARDAGGGGGDEKEDKILKIKEEATRLKCNASVPEGLEPVAVAARKEDEPDPPPEHESIPIPLHWHPKPCLQIAGLGGSVSQEELISLISKHAPVSSIVFENERRDAVIVRLQCSPGEEDKVVLAVMEALNKTHFKDKTLAVDSHRPDSLLFIGNLTPEIDDELLKKMFEPHGTIERAFVLRNEEGRSKGYGFVEYSLKSQANTAKQIMGNINMDGRVLRVEWSDCKKVEDMFSSVLFVDRIAKECPNIENVLRTLFGEYGKVRDCHLAIAHEALDGTAVEDSNIRVSFANPSKSAQSYKFRFGSQGILGGLAARGLPSVMPAMVGAALRSQLAMPYLAPRFFGPRPGLLGMGIGMQFGAPVGPGMIGRSLVGPLLGVGAGMLGPGSIAGMIGRAPGLLMGPVPISPATIAQVATAQAKAREEEAKARAELRRLQQVAQQAQAAQQPAQNFYQQAQSGIGQEGQYSYQQVYQQTGVQPSSTQPTQLHAHQSCTSPYYSQSGQQQYIHQQQPSQPQLQAAYCQQQPLQSNGQNPSVSHQQYNHYSQQYTQLEDQQETQQCSLPQYGQFHSQTKAQVPCQQYSQHYQHNRSEKQYSQQECAEYYTQQQQLQQGTMSIPAVPAANVITQAHNVAHEQNSTYYQQQVASIAGGSDQTVEAQWAAYYSALQAAHQNGIPIGSDQQGMYGQQQAYNGIAATAAYCQQPATPAIGQKRSADQMEYISQSQHKANTYHQQAQQPAGSMGTNQQSATTTDTIYQQQAGSYVTNYHQAASFVDYQQNASTGYTASHQQPATFTFPMYQQLAPSSYCQQTVGSYKQPSQATQVATDFNNRLRY